MLEIRNLSLAFAGKELFNNASLLLKSRSRVGLIGRNGSGKSTLFKMILGEIVQDGGEISYPKGLRISSVKQETPSSELSILDYVMEGDEVVTKAKKDLLIAEEKNDGLEIARLHQILDEADAYSINSRASVLLLGLGYTQEELKKPVSSFSGGWRMRLNLARALIKPHDLLLLDEPTNHLDVEAIMWLENWLRQQDGMRIIITHDSEFLNNTVEEIVEIHDKGFSQYGGNYDFYLKEKAERLNRQAASYKKQQAYIEHMESFIRRFRYKATKSRQAQSRIKALEKLELIAPASLDSEYSFNFLEADDVSNPLLKIVKANMGYEDKEVLKDVNLILEKGQRIGLLGVNGAGKSTFVKSISDNLPLLSGEIVKAQKLKIGYFAQHQLDVLNLSESPLWHMQRINEKDLTDQELRDHLGSFNIRGDDAVNPITNFSGGEKTRLALALLIFQKPNLLLMDEPTNHLDLAMREALTLALQGFNGSMILIAHDRNLLMNTCDSFWLVDGGKVEEYDGDLASYRDKVLNERKEESRQQSAQNKAQSQAAKDGGDAQDGQSDDRSREARRQKGLLQQSLRDATKDLNKKLKKKEEELATAETRKGEIEAILADNGIYDESRKEELLSIMEEHAAILKNVEGLEEECMELMEEISAVEEEVKSKFG